MFGDKNGEIGCSCALLMGGERYLCNIHGAECLFLVPDSKLCAEVYNEGPDAVNSKELFKSVEKFVTRYADEEGISIEEAKKIPLVKAYDKNFDKMLEQHRTNCRYLFQREEEPV